MQVTAALSTLMERRRGSGFRNQSIGSGHCARTPNEQMGASAAHAPGVRLCRRKVQRGAAMPGASHAAPSERALCTATSSTSTSHPCSPGGVGYLKFEDPKTPLCNATSSASSSHPCSPGFAPALALPGRGKSSRAGLHPRDAAAQCPNVPHGRPVAARGPVSGSEGLSSHAACAMSKHGRPDTPGVPTTTEPSLGFMASHLDPADPSLGLTGCSITRSASAPQSSGGAGSAAGCPSITASRRTRAAAAPGSASPCGRVCGGPRASPRRCARPARMTASPTPVVLTATPGLRSPNSAPF